MVYTRYHRSEGSDKQELQMLDDPAEEAERELQLMDRVRSETQPGNVRDREATPFPKAVEGCFPPVAETNFQSPHSKIVNVCSAATRAVTRSSTKTTPRRSPRLIEGTPPRQVHFDPRLTTPQQKAQPTKYNQRKYTSPSPPPPV